MLLKSCSRCLGSSLRGHRVVLSQSKSGFSVLFFRRHMKRPFPNNDMTHVLRGPIRHHLAPRTRPHLLARPKPPPSPALLRLEPRTVRLCIRRMVPLQSTRPAGSPSRSVPGCPHSVPFGAKLIVPHGGTAGTSGVQALAVHCHERQWMACGFTGCSLYRTGWTPRMRAGHCLGGAGRSVPRRLRSHRHSLDPIRCQFQNSQRPASR